MKFTLTYDGELPSATSSNTRTKEKWEIRKTLHPQLAELWESSSILKVVLRDRLIPKGGSYMRFFEHHTARRSEPSKFAGTDVTTLNNKMEGLRDSVWVKDGVR